MNGATPSNPADATAALIRVEQDRLFTLAGLLLGDDREAEAASGQACEAAYRRLVECGPASFREALYTCLVMVCEQVCRARQLSFRQSVPAPRRGGLDGLPFSRRAALALVEVGGFHYAEVARILGCSPQEVCTNVAAGRVTLAKSLARVIS